MASSTPIYKAYVGIIPSAKGFGKSLEGELSNANMQGAANRVGDRAGRSLGTRLTGAFKSALKIGAVITAAVGAAAIGGGISRQLNIEDAQKKLEGLGHSTKNIETIMVSALDSVKGTAYGLDSAATQAAGAVAAGVKPGKELTSYLKLTADAATIAGVSMDEMGFVMNKVQTGQQAYTEDLNMLADRGIPIFQWLQEEYGVTAEELKKMVSDGKVDAETYFKVIEENIGGAALKSGETTRGAAKNMFAALSRVGVALTSGFFPLIREGFVGVTSILDAVTPKLEEVFSPMWEILQPLFSSAISSMSGGLSDWITNLDVSGIASFFEEGARGVLAFVEAWKANDGTVTSSGFPGFMENLANIARNVWGELTGGIEAFGAAWQANDGDITSSGFPGFMELAAHTIRQVIDAIKNLDYSSLSGFFDSLGGMDIDFSGLSGIGSGIGPVIKSVADSFLLIAKTSPKLLAIALELLADALGFVADHAGKIVPLIPWIIAGFAAYKVTVLTLNSALAANTALDIASLPIQIKRNVTSMQAAQARLAAANATRGETLADAQQQISSTRVTLAQRMRTITTKAQTIAQKASTIATKAGAIATNLLGKAIRFATGPIGLIIIGITLLVGALIWFFTKTETGQKIWEKVWGAIKNAAGAVADWFMGTVVPLLLSAWDMIVDGALWLYDNVIKKAWDGIKTGIQATADWIMNTLVPWLVSAWDAISAGAVWLYENVMKPVWTGIKTAIAIAVTAVLLYIDLLKWYFSNVIAPVAIWLYENVIKPVWDGIKKAIAATIDWFVNTGWPMLKAAWDAVAGAVKWLYESAILPVWNAIKAAIKAVVDWFQNTAWPAAKKVIDFFALGFRNLYSMFIKPAWDAIKSAIDSVVKWFQNTAWPLVKSVIDAIKLGFNVMRDSLKAAWQFIKDRVINPVATWFRDTIRPMITNAIDAIKTAFTVMRDHLKSVWNFIKDKVIAPVANWFRDTIKPLFDTVTGGIKDSFNLLKDAVQKAWNGIRDTAKAPIKFLVETIIRDNIIKKYNEVANGVFGLDKVDEDKFSVGWARGGILPGYRAMHRGDDVLTPMRSGEGVLVSEGLRDKASRSMFLAANYAAKKGRSFAEFISQSTGYAKGGIVKLGMPFAGSYPRGDGFGARGGKHKGIDWPMPSGAQLLAVAAGTAGRTWNPAAGNKLNLNIGNGLVAGYHHLSSYIASRGAQVAAGDPIARVGSTGRSSGPHLHFSLKKDGSYVDPLPYLGAGGAAGDGDGGGWNPFAGLWDSLKTKVREGVGNSAFGDTLFEMPKKILGGAVEWAAAKLAEIGDFAGEAVAGVAGRAQWSGRMTQALLMKGQGGPMRLKWGLDRLMQESGGDPNAVNNWDSNAKKGTPSKGLMQVIDPTFRAFAEPGYSSNIFDPLSNILASINYTLATYGTLKKGWTRKGGYAEGGLVDHARLMDRGGYLMPGVNHILNKTGGYETVIPRVESEYLRDLATGKLSGGAQTIYQNTIHAETDKAKELVDELMWEQKKAERRNQGRYTRTGG